MKNNILITMGILVLLGIAVQGLFGIEARDSYLYRDLIDYDVRCCRHRYAESVFR